MLFFLTHKMGLPCDTALPPGLTNTGGVRMPPFTNILGLNIPFAPKLGLTMDRQCAMLTFVDHQLKPVACTFTDKPVF